MFYITKSIINNKYIKELIKNLECHCLKLQNQHKTCLILEAIASGF